MLLSSQLWAAWCPHPCCSPAAPRPASKGTATERPGPGVVPGGSTRLFRSHQEVEAQTGQGA